MKTHELFERLALGELSNLAISESDDKFLKTDTHPKIILYINEGLLKIYSRYVLLEKSLIIEQQEHITNYHMKKRYAESSSSDEPYKYIKDLPGDPFTEDVIKILTVYDQYGHEYPLNDPQNIHSCFTPQPSQLQILNPVTCRAMGIMYQARHPVLVCDDNVLNQHIELPFSLESALQAYVAAKVYSHMNGQENKMISQEHLGNYEMICVDLEAKDLINSTHHTSHHKLEERGFV